MSALALPMRRRTSSTRKALWCAVAFALFATIGASLYLVATYATAAEAKAVLPDSADLSAAAQNELIAVTRDPLAAPQAEGLAAQQINAALPFSAAPIESAAPFSLAGAALEDRAQAQLCLTQAIYYEAGFEPVVGRRAVAQVILNRMRHPAFAKSVCGVVYEGSTRPGCQFSFTCDGSLGKAPAAAAWAQAAIIAREALAGHVAAEVGQATHYHTDYVAPYWAPKLSKITQIGAHIFYRWPGSWGLKRAFTGRYAGGEKPGSGSVPATEELAVAAELALPVQAPDDRRAPNDVGGRLDTSKGWTLSIPDPRETRGALSQALAAQQKTELASAAAGGHNVAGKAIAQ
jgi:spore germination cell wall hydrolase CwlJ-like protein